MQGNKQAYDEAYQRAAAGKSAALLDLLKRPFEDTYTRQSRERGEKDGLAAREAATATAQPATAE